MRIWKILSTSFIVTLVVGLYAHAEPPDAQRLVADGFAYLRGKASASLVDMTIHRPAWQRVVTIKAWTVGEADSIFRILAPPKDEGNGTLKKGGQMWMYNPKVNRVIKLPPSMMSQSWMGSDFSNNDLAKSDTILNDYEHTVMGTDIHDGKTVYLIESIPKPEAPVVWGKQRLALREDNVWLRQEYYDEDMQLVKTMSGHDIGLIGGRLFPKRWRMQKADRQDAYTELIYRELAFKDSLPARLFSLSNLKTPER